MTAVSQLELNRDEFSKRSPEDLAKIINELAGGKSNIRMVVPGVRITIGNKLFEAAGEVSFNILKNSTDGNAGYPVETREETGNPPLMKQFGTVRVLGGDVSVLRVNVEGRRLDLDIEDKQFIKRVIKLGRKILSVKTPKQEMATEKEKKKASLLKSVRTIADTCKKLGLTVTVSYNGRRIATIGADANPTLLHFVTKTRALAINSIPAAIELLL